ncbi:SAC3 family protein A isoform X2 [Carica papaya]|uniref:SAC3 family protein A isoform X2 n=1 Tax=Carica papaya TaxID=3649 RepID=UPI000B8CE183|nr:SAC3 family protein A isoform X2 [Carica papaya]
MMMNQGGNTQTVATVDPKSIENRYVVDANQVQTSSYLPLATGSDVASWTMNRVDSRPIENGNVSNSSYHHEHYTEPTTRAPQDGVNATSFASTPSLGTANVAQDYSGYASYPSSTDPYGYGSTGYPGYYNGYQQQQPNHSYPQPVGAYQNTGAPYQPLSSFQNAGSYAGPASYSSTYYNPGDYQTAGGYPSSGYSNQTSSWNEGNYANYTGHPYSNYPTDTTAAYSSSTVTAPSLHYQQSYKQWADYYSQTEVSCAPGTENFSVASTSNQVCPVAGATGGISSSNSQNVPSFIHSWRPDSTSSQMPSSQEQQQAALPQGPNSHSSVVHQVSQNYQQPVQTVSSLDTRRASKLQIPTNPRIASHLPVGLPKSEKDSTPPVATAKPAYISVSLPKPTDHTADSILKPGMFPKSLRGYVERALARCKDDRQKAGCQAALKEIITKATADNTLHTRDWDIEPLFPLLNVESVHDDMQSSTPVSALSKFKKSPSRRSKSRWEPLPEEKSIDKLPPVGSNTAKFSGWLHLNEKDRKPLANSEGKMNSLSTLQSPLSEQKPANKNVQRPVKRQRVTNGLNATDNADASSDSDKEQSLTAYYSGAMALANSPEEKKRRENRSKRFEKGQGHRAESNVFKTKNARAGNVYVRRASALVLSKNFDNCGSQAVEDIDWDALTVKGTCQELEKRYLRLTSAPDPSSVRREEVLEKALLMVQNSQKNYLYKCDQLKSIRQDLTVQRIHNQLTVKVYETHARLALEAGDLPEYNQCQSQLKSLYAEGIEGCRREFSAYNLLCVILHSNNNRDLSSSMAGLSKEAKKNEVIKHALAVRSAVTSGNYVMFFRLYKTAPNLSSCLMDLYVEKMRYKALNCMSRSYRPTLSVSYIAQVLGFTEGTPSKEGKDEKDLDGFEECVEWLKAHGACLIADNNGDMQLDAKTSSSSLCMPEPEDAVAHGDANLAVNDFFTRTSS